MKKYYGFLVLIVLWIVLFPTASLAAPAERITVRIDGQTIAFTGINPVRTEGRVMVPLRTMAEAMGATVSWNNATRSITAELNSISLEVVINSLYSQRTITDSSGTSTSRVAKMEGTPILINENTVIPLRAVAEFLGYTVKWNEQTKTAELSYTGPADTPISFADYPLLGDSKRLSSQELEVFFLTNQVRTDQSIAKPLGLHVELSMVAREKSKDMNDQQYFSHTSPTYGSPFEMMEAFGFPYKAAGENLAMGYPTPARAMQGWEDSPGHLENILSNSYEYVGVGFYEGTNLYWTQHFFTGLP